jgi:hypothetical protein
MMMVRSRGIIGLSDYRGGRDIWSRVGLGSIAYRGVLVRRKARPRAYSSRMEAGRRAARLGDDYAMLGGVRVTWSYVASCRYLRTLSAEGRRTRGLL